MDWASPLTTARDAVASAEFGAGIRFGLIAGAVGLAVGLAWRAGVRAPAPVGGLLLAAASALALNDVLELPGELGLVLVCLAVAGLLDDLLEVPVPVRFLLPVPGAWLFLTRVDLAGPGWVSIAGAATIVVGGTLAAEFDRRYREWAIGNLFVAVAAVGVYLTVPDTEHALVLMAAALVLVPLGWPARICRLGSGGALAAVGMLVWVVGVDGVGRESSMVGGLACLGLLVAEPAAALLFAARRPRSFAILGRRWTAVPAATLIHMASVLVASRVAGLRPTPQGAVLIAAASVGVTVAVMAWMARSGPVASNPRPRHGH